MLMENEYPDNKFYCHKCGAEMVRGKVVRHRLGYNRYTGNPKVRYIAEFRCPHWKRLRFTGHTRGLAVIMYHGDNSDKKPKEWHEYIGRGASGW